MNPEGPQNKERMPEIEITAPAPGDGKGMQEVFYRTWLATYPNEEAGITAEDIEYRFKDRLSEEKIASVEKRMLNPVEGETLFLAKSEGRVVGVCRIVKGDEANRLQAIYVLPEFQGEGVGKKLWEEAKKHFDPEKDSTVQAVTYNANAIKFYEGLGFVDTGKRIEDERMESGAVMTILEMRRKADKS